MAKILNEVDKLLRQGFPRAKTELELSPGSSRVTGLLIWKGFVGEDQIDRQHRVWELIHQSLSPEQRKQVSAIYTVTPEELAVMREG